MIPINSPVTATMPGGQKMKGYLEDCEPYDGSFLYLIRDGQDFDYKFFEDREVKIRYDNPAPFTLWQLKALNYKSCQDGYSETWCNRFITIPKTQDQELSQYCWCIFNTYY